MTKQNQRSENKYREKGRAVFLAAIMLLSVVLVAIAFTGPKV